MADMASKPPPSSFRNGSHESELIGDDDIVALNQSLLNSIATGDYATYDLLCTHDLTCFEPETKGTLVEGKEFHKFYFDLPSNREWGKLHIDTHVTMSNVHVRRMGKDVAIVTYVRLDQAWTEGEATTQKCCETRVWERSSLQWKCVHVHRS